MTTATADIADVDLDREMQQTLAEMGETPPPDGPPQTTEADAEPGPLAWVQRGAWGFANYSPATLGADSDGRLILSFKFHSTRAPRLGELSAKADERVSSTRVAVLAALQSTPEWQQFLEAKAECDGTQQQLEELESQRRKLEQERTRLASKPKGQGGRLAAIQEEQEALGKRIHAARTELAALRPILDSARLRAQQVTKQLTIDTVRAAGEEYQAEFRRAMEDFGKKHAEELTAIASLLHARRARQPETWAPELQTFALEAMEQARPLPETAAV